MAMAYKSAFETSNVVIFTYPETLFLNLLSSFTLTTFDISGLSQKYSRFTHYFPLASSLPPWEASCLTTQECCLLVMLVYIR